MTVSAARMQEAGFSDLRGFLLILAVYTGLHLVLGLVLDRAAGVDDVAEAIFAQTLEWGYYPRQPPAYTWLQWAAFQVFGVTPLAQAVLRYALVALGYLFFYFSARRLLSDPRLALLAGLSPTLIYAIGWGVHVGFTNTLILTAACAATFYAFIRILQGGGVGSYVGLGAALAVGTLSKFGFPIFALSLVGAGLVQPATRRRLVDRRMLLALAVLCVLLAPYFLWGFEGTGAFQTVFTKTMKEGGGMPYLTGVVSGLATLVEAVVAFLAPLWLFLLLVFPRAAWPGPRADGSGTVRRGPALDGDAQDWDARRLLEHFFIAIFAILVLGVFVAGITYFKSRWMHPALLVFPIYYFLRVEATGFSTRQVRRYMQILAGVAALAAVFRIAQAEIGPPLCSSCRLSMPYPELAEAVAARGFDGGTILAEEEHIAGNFRMRFPDSRVISVSYPFYTPPLGPVGGVPARCLVVWHARDGDPGVPEPIVEFAAQRLGLDLRDSRASGQVGAEPHFRDGRVIRLDYWLGPGTGRCR